MQPNALLRLLFALSANGTLENTDLCPHWSRPQKPGKFPLFFRQTKLRAAYKSPRIYISGLELVLSTENGLTGSL